MAKRRTTDRLRALERQSAEQLARPTNLVSREARGAHGRRRAQWFHFTVDSNFTTASATADVTVTGYGDGVDPDPTAAGITVKNIASGGGGYIFAGDAGDVGKAIRKSNGDYVIDWVECSD